MTEPGAHATKALTHFTVHATTLVTLCLFDGDTEHRFAMTRDGDIWTATAHAPPGTRYGFRGEIDPAKLLVDPYAIELDQPFVYDPRLREPGIDTGPLVPKAIVQHPVALPDPPPPLFAPGGLIYELNVRGFTMLHPDVPAAQRGTIAALAHPAVIAHFRKLRVTAIELMPIVAWIDERHLPPLGLTNAWGYNPVVPMALDPRLAPGGVAELRDTVAALREAGIGVILDLVFNHSGESDEHGPTLSFRGLDPDAYAPPPPAPAPVAPEGHDGPAPGTAPGDDVDLVEGAEAFASLRVSDVMTPRADITALEVSTPLEEVVRRFVEAELTRMPLYRESLDDPVGVLHIKDLVRLIAPQPDGRGPAWTAPAPKRLRRQVLYVPASMRCADLLLRMRLARIHMALVIDEHGGTDGLVTLEDLIEAVVGDIDDEHDEHEAPEIVARAGEWDADARAPREDLEAFVGRPLQPEDEEEEIETVGGLVSALAGRVPQRGEVIVHDAAGLEFEVLDADPRRVRRVRVRPAAKPNEAVDAAPAAESTPDPLALDAPPVFGPGDGST